MNNKYIVQRLEFIVLKKQIFLSRIERKQLRKTVNVTITLRTVFLNWSNHRTHISLWSYVNHDQGGRGGV